MDLHVHCFGAARLDVVGDKAMGCAVVGLDGCGRLLVSHLFEEVLHGNCFTGVDVEGTKLGFNCTGHDSLEYFGDVEHGTIVGWVVHIRQAEKVAADSTSRCRFSEVQGITMDGQHHVTFFVG